MLARPSGWISCAVRGVCLPLQFGTRLNTDGEGMGPLSDPSLGAGPDFGAKDVVGINEPVNEITGKPFHAASFPSTVRA